MNADGLRDEVAAALHGQGVWYIASDDMATDLADAVLPVLRRHIDAAREQDLAAIEAQIAEHVATRVTSLKELVDTLVALDDKHTAERDAAVARAEAAEQTLQRVRAVLAGHSSLIAVDELRRALDGTP